MTGDFPFREVAPLAVGGVGGSGTRLIAQILQEVGFYLGGDLNAASDNLWFTLLFRRAEILQASQEEFEQLLIIFMSGLLGGIAFDEKHAALVNQLASADRPLNRAAFLKKRAKSLLRRAQEPRIQGPFGWKAPNTHIIMDRLQPYLPRMKYIHVARNGLDMAYSTNQNQLTLWGSHFLGDEAQLTPRASLKLWHRVHKRILEICAPMQDRFLFLNYDRFCAEPEEGIRRLLDFAGLPQVPPSLHYLTSLVKLPSSIGRYKDHGLAPFDAEDIAFVRELGFDLDTA